MCQREEEEGRGWTRRKEKEGDGLKTGEEERKYMTTKHRYRSSYVHFIPLVVKLSEVGRSTMP